jgi:hypothetical protein
MKNDSMWEIQTIGVSMIGFSMLFADCVIIKPVKIRVHIMRYFPDKVLSNPWTYFFPAIIIMIYHVLQMGKIPFVEKYFVGEKGFVALAILREQSSKLLNVPSVLKYAFSWLTSLLMPITISLFFMRRQYGYALIAFGFAIIYALLTLAFFPAALLIFTLLMIWMFYSGVKIRPVYVYILTTILMLLIFRASWLIYFSCSTAGYEPVSSLQTTVDHEKNVLSWADRYRLMQKNEWSLEQRAYAYFAYRVFLVPVEVSHNWYKYYPLINGRFIGVEDYFGKRGTDFIHPANRVGLWAYHEKMPDKYLRSVHAYASLDADAHARAGVNGLIVVSFLLIVLRVVQKLSYVDSSLGKTLYAIGICQLSLLPAQASIAAILVAHGFLPLLFLMILHSLSSSPAVLKKSSRTYAL